jgi:hypothetical protein
MCVNTSIAQELVSANPRYLSIILPELGAKGVSVVFDESKGTGKGCDIVYVDANLNGKIDDGEKYTAPSDDPQYDGVVIHSFPFIALNPAQKKAVSYHITFFYLLNHGRETFSVEVYKELRYKNKAWRVMYSGDVKPSKNSASPMLFKPIQVPKANVKSGPSEKATGIAISLASGGIDVSSSNATVSLVLKNSSGKIMKKTSGSLDKFGFG